MLGALTPALLVPPAAHRRCRCTAAATTRARVADAARDAHATVRAAARLGAATAASLVISAAVTLGGGAAHAEVCTLDGVCVEQREPDSDLSLILRERSRANREAYDAARLDNFYKRDWRINKLVGRDALPEPCDPRQPEFRTKCVPNGGLLPPEALQ